MAASSAAADLATDLQRCRAETDSLKRLTCFDSIRPEGAATAAHIAPRPQSASPVTITDVELRTQGKDLKSSVYNPRVEAILTFRNDSKKTVVAVEHTLIIADAFGEKVIDGSSKLDIKIPPGKTVRSETFYYWQDNPFMSGEPYDRLYGPVGTGVAKATIAVTKAVFSDGSVETYR
ncbi:hypothetical protein CO661_11850 [Sinorhizobium fredii]|uniref:Uncharacterized protein n=2 Tax=Rhizobium fredii TaxID=380 RepID=A0A2A6LY10_RHIFR|nr:hypothetical protein CO661_11850 [Sinorhizobium fredii]